MASFSTFTDPLVSSTQNTSLWSGNFGTLSWTGGGFTITNPASYTGYGGQDTTAAYDLTGAASWCSMNSVGSQTLASCETVPIKLVKDASNSIFWYLNLGNLLAIKQVAGTQTTITTTTYSATNHKWFSIAEGAGRKGGTGVAGTIYFETSPDGLTWTLITSLANPFAVTALQLEPSLGTYNAEASATSAKWNSFNVAAVAPSGNTGAFFAMF